MIIPFPIQEGQPVDLLERELNRKLIPDFERLSHLPAAGQARDEDCFRVPVAGANLQGAFGKFACLGPIVLHVKADRQFSEKMKPEWVIRIEPQRKKKRRYALLRLPREDVACAKTSMRRCEARVERDRIVKVDARFLGLAHDHQGKPDQELGPCVAPVDERRFASELLGDAQP